MPLTQVQGGMSLTPIAGTAVASTSGTSIDFTGIPSWVKRVTVMYSGISVNGTANFIIQVGAGSVTTSGYTSTMSLAVNATLSTTTSTSGLVFASAANAGFTYSGQLILSTLGSNKWVCSVNTNEDSSARAMFGAGSITLGGALDRVRFTTTTGTDTFDAGTINILYE
jgi:hypothetical protein